MISQTWMVGRLPLKRLHRNTRCPTLIVTLATEIFGQPWRWLQLRPHVGLRNGLASSRRTRKAHSVGNLPTFSSIRCFSGAGNGTIVQDKENAESWEEDAFSLIWEAALKNVGEHFLDCEDYVRWFLGYIGLMTITDDGDWIPTRRLLNLAAECRWRERDKVQKAI
jgi:hypothetical protein